MSATDFSKTRTNGGLGLPPQAMMPLRRPEDMAGKPRSAAEAVPERTPAAHDPHVGVRSPTKSDFAIGRKIRELRRARVITQKELAAMVGVTGAQLHRYEMGTTRVAASRLIAIAESLDVHADVLMGSATTHELSPAFLASSDGDDDIIELIHVFSHITEHKNRCAIIAVARMLAAKSAAATKDSE